MDKKAYYREYYLKNKEKMKAKSKANYHDNIEERKNQQKEYRESNIEKIKAKHKEYYYENIEKIKAKHKEYMKEYYYENIEKIKEYQREYDKTPNRKKSRTISDWKKYGIISEDYDALYQKYLDCKNCEECGCEYGGYRDGTGKWRCLDHCHESGLFRNFLCNACNLKRR